MAKLITPRPMDFWRVNSYGYPNPLIEDSKSQDAWTTLVSFYQHGSYSDLKEYWASGAAQRRLSSHAVESWKATFEEFGLLYVLRGTDEIQITPAGSQYLAAAESGNESLLAWIGLSLLLRYPLRGPRRAKSDAHEESDLLLYRFLYAAMHDLHGYFWWTELERILCRVFLTEQASQAVNDVLQIRGNPADFESFAMPAKKRQGALYNSLNQVVVHASMNHMMFMRETDSAHYGDDEPKRRHFFSREWLPFIRDALNLVGESHECGDSASAVSRLPRAPSFDDEESYFSYLGAEIPDRSSRELASPFPTLSVGGDMVAVLEEGEHFDVVSSTSIGGDVRVLCRLSVGQRIVLSSNQHWTYIVVSKQLQTAENLVVSIRRARPISDNAIFAALLEERDA